MASSRLPPHKFIIAGKVWTMRYGLPKGTRRRQDIFDSSGDLGACAWWRRQIILHPSLRKSPRLAWETWVHELFHAWAHTHGLPLVTHDMIRVLEAPLGQFLWENGSRTTVGKKVGKPQSSSSSSSRGRSSVG